MSTRIEDLPNFNTSQLTDSLCTIVSRQIQHLQIVIMIIIITLGIMIFQYVSQKLRKHCLVYEVQEASELNVFHIDKVDDNIVSSTV